ncbi:MAG TPA: type II secretion system protein GspJ [Spirochaetota bacterium]|nr:type II secretion system protein GspJ [Spirochaetota bacterium]HPJ35407.1 type II secretion system protein GspJ [Spirochaetota bacterium]
MKPVSDNSGFTLIEMLVAAAVSSIILIMVYTAYSSVIKSIKYGSTASDYYERLNFALRRIDTDISNLYWNKDLKDLCIVCTEKTGSSILNFITAEYRNSKLIYNLKNQVPVSDVHEVGYYLRQKSGSDSFELIRRSSIGYDDSPLEGGVEEILLKNVRSLNFEFKYRNDWVREWDSRETKKIPKLVKTTLIVNDLSRGTEKYEFLSIPNIAGD